MTLLKRMRFDMISGRVGFRPNREYEALSRRGKNWWKWDPGVRSKAKRRYWKQDRQAARREMLIESDCVIQP